MFRIPIYRMIKEGIARPMTALVCCIAMLVITNSCDESESVKPMHEAGTVTDHEGNVYKTVKIGNQWWMAENLRSTSFRSGSSIPYVESQDTWFQTDEPGYVRYQHITSGSLLYNFYVITSTEEIAPEGWHIPTDEEWKELEEYLGMPVSELDKTNWRGTNEGDALKEETDLTNGWIPYEGVWGTNESGFTAIGGSCRVFNGEWGVPGLRHSGFWWTASEKNEYGWYRYLDYKRSGIFRYSAHPNYGFSVRCVKDE